MKSEKSILMPGQLGERLDKVGEPLRAELLYESFLGYSCRVRDDLGRPPTLRGKQEVCPTAVGVIGRSIDESSVHQSVDEF